MYARNFVGQNFTSQKIHVTSKLYSKKTVKILKNASNIHLQNLF